MPLVAGCFVDASWRTLLWAVAVCIDYLGVYLTSANWRVHAPGHFAERHQLVVMIAIGESIVAVGLGLHVAPLSALLLVGAVLGIVLAITLWWTYFDALALVAERVLRRLQGDARTRLATDSFTYLHLPIVVGIIYRALGVRVVLEGVVGAPTSPAAALSPLVLTALFGGLALYLASLSLLQRRDLGALNRERAAAAVLLGCLGVACWAARLPPTADLALAVAAMAGLICYETVHYRQLREKVRRGAGHGTMPGDGR